MEDERLKREKKNRLDKKDREIAKILKKADKHRIRQKNKKINPEELAEDSSILE